MCDTKKLRVAVGKTYPLEQIADAHKDVESRAVIGNVVLEI